MLRKYVLRNRDLSLWLGGATLLSGNCSFGGGSGAGGVLDAVAALLQVIGSAL